MTSRWKRFRKFFHEVKVELKRVHWPNRREFIAFTTIVITAILAIGIFFWILDTGFTALVRVLIEH